jgi:hypothetical protein
VRCHDCSKTIPPVEQRRAHIEKDDEGRIKCAYHKRCWARVKARTKQTGPMPGNVYREDRPGAYDMTTLTKDDLTPEQQEGREEADRELVRLRQEQIAEDREEEPRPEAWNDWREPQTVDLEELATDA